MQRTPRLNSFSILKYINSLSGQLRFINVENKCGEESNHFNKVADLNGCHETMHQIRKRGKKSSLTLVDGMYPRNNGSTTSTVCMAIAEDVLGQLPIVPRVYQGREDHMVMTTQISLTCVA